VVKVPVQPDTSPNARFKVLLTEDRPHAPEHWISQLPRLLEPQGIAAYVARSGAEAVELADQLKVHAAIIDLATPLEAPNRAGAFAPRPADREAAGLRLLELFMRLPNRPALVVVHRPAYTPEADRLMREALRLGAFSVLHKPVELEQILGVFRRLLDRQHSGAWPGAQPAQPSPQPQTQPRPGNAPPRIAGFRVNFRFTRRPSNPGGPPQS